MRKQYPGYPGLQVRVARGRYVGLQGKDHQGMGPLYAIGIANILGACQSGYNGEGLMQIDKPVDPELNAACASAEKRLEDHRQRGFPAVHTRIEEANGRRNLPVCDQYTQFT